MLLYPGDIKNKFSQKEREIMKKRLLAAALIMTLVLSLNVVQGFAAKADDGFMDIGGITFSYTKAGSSIKNVKMEVDGGLYNSVQRYDLTMPTGYTTKKDSLSVKVGLAGSSSNIKVFAEYLSNTGEIIKIPMTSKYRVVEGLFKEEINPDSLRIAIYDKAGSLIKAYTVHFVYGDDYFLDKNEKFFKVKSYLTNNPCYKEGKKIKVKGLMLHSVGEPRPRAEYYINKWDNPDFRKACVHGFINADDGSLYQTLPWNRRAWHAAGTANNTHIGIEMCEPENIRYTSATTFVSDDILSARRDATRTYNSAVQVFAELCIKYNLNPLAKGVIISHSEGYKAGKASKHADPEHLWKGLGLSYTMKGFRQDVKDMMVEMKKDMQKKAS